MLLGALSSVVLRNRDNSFSDSQLEEFPSLHRRNFDPETFLNTEDYAHSLDMDGQEYTMYTGYSAHGIDPIPRNYRDDLDTLVLSNDTSAAVKNSCVHFIVNGIDFHTGLGAQTPKILYDRCLFTLIKIHERRHYSGRSDDRGSYRNRGWSKISHGIKCILNSAKNYIPNSGKPPNPLPLMNYSRPGGVIKPSFNTIISNIISNDGKEPNLDFLRSSALKCICALAEVLHHKKSMLLLANLYFTGMYGVERDFNMAYKFYSGLASRFGDPGSYRMIGLMYAIGLGVEHDYALANLYITIASASGDLLATQILAYWSYAGVGTEKDMESALALYKALARKAIDFYLSRNALFGQRLPHQPPYAYSKAPQLYGINPVNPTPRRASEMASVSEHVLEDKDLWQAYYLRAKNGDPVANLIMGFIYYNEKFPGDQTYKKSLHHFEEALSEYIKYVNNTHDESVDYQTAKFAASNALGMIGRMYWAGEGVESNARVARNFLEKGAELGDGQSLNYLAMMYKHGAGDIPPDLVRAREYFAKAIRAKSVEAVYNLALTNFESGNFTVAYYGFKASHSLGHFMSTYYIAIMKEIGLGTRKDKASAAALYKWVVEAANWHDPTIRLAERYEKLDPELSFLYYLIASECGYELAQVNAAIKIDREEVAISKSKSLSSSIRDEYTLALKLLYRASAQGDPYALHKVADYFYYGIGTRNFRYNPVSKKLYYLGDAYDAKNSTQITDEGDLKLDKSERSDRTDTDPSSTAPSKLPISFVKSLFLAAVDKMAHIFHIKYKLRATKGARDPYVAAIIYKESIKSCRAPISVWNLAWMYENGVGVTKDYELAMYMYKASAKDSKYYMAGAVSVVRLSIRMFIESKISYIKSFFLHKKPVAAETEHTREPEDTASQ